MKKNSRRGMVLLFLCFLAAIFIKPADTVNAASVPAAGASASQRVPGKWFYVKDLGYYKKENGICYRGWLSWKDHVYYLTKSTGAKAVGFRTIDGKRYYFRRGSGRLQLNGWFQVNSKRYYADSDGVLKTGWFSCQNKKYYFSKKGILRTGWRKINGRRYYFDSDGVLAEKNWVDVKHYADKNGVVKFVTKKKRKNTFRWPLNAKRKDISSYFGYRGPMPVGTSDHDGIDIPANMNTPIRAGAAGTVIVRDYNDSAGNHIEINHHNGLVTKYMHMTRFKSNVKRGSKVKKGQIIGYVGSTGWSTGPHLHFGVQVNGTMQDPLNFVTQPR